MIDIVIVNWNAGDLLKFCLKSIEKFHGGVVSKVVVVDNASTDGSLQNLEAINIPLQIICNDENKGFGVACNQGTAICDAPYLLFLNPDTRIFECSLKKTLNFMEDDKNKKVGICGIQLVDKQGHVARTCAYFPSLLRFSAESIGLNKFPGLKGRGVHMADWEHDSTQIVDHVIGAFFFIRRSLFESLQGFDERFFVYLEDIDVSYRARLAGWETIYLSQAQAFHEGGGTSKQVKATRLFYSLRSRLLYGFKHFPAWQAWTLVVMTFVLELISRTVFSLLRGGFSDVMNTWKGYKMLYVDIPNIIRLTEVHKKR